MFETLLFQAEFGDYQNFTPETLGQAQASTALRFAHHEAFPFPRRSPGEAPTHLAKSYLQTWGRFKADLLPNSPLTDAALVVYNHCLPYLVDTPRWVNYGVPETSDMNDAGHQGRQGLTAAQALFFDKDYFGFTTPQTDGLVSASFIHDIGEITDRTIIGDVAKQVGDITYDLKQQSKTSLEIAEARIVAKIIGETDGLDQQSKDQLLEVYLRVVTNLSDTKVWELSGKPNCVPDFMRWGDLRRVFNLYERYGYLTTAFQNSPIDDILYYNLVEYEPEYLEMARTWDRPELEATDKSGLRMPEWVRFAVLERNVLNNQWKYLVKAQAEGIPSAAIFTQNPAMQFEVNRANRFFIGLNLDTSIFANSLSEFREVKFINP